MIFFSYMYYGWDRRWALEMLGRGRERGKRGLVEASGCRRVGTPSLVLSLAEPPHAHE